MRQLMLICLIAANRARTLATEQGQRVEQLLLAPNFVLLIRKYCETQAGEPILASVPVALERILANEAKGADPVMAGDVLIARDLLVQVLADREENKHV